MQTIPLFSFINRFDDKMKLHTMSNIISERLQLNNNLIDSYSIIFLILLIQNPGDIGENIIIMMALPSIYIKRKLKRR